MEMRKVSKSVIAVAVALGLSACGSPPKQVFPDGASRVPANDPQRLAEVKENNAQQRKLQLENDTLRTQAAALQKQMDDLRSAVTGVIASALKPAPQSVVPQAAPAAPTQPQQTKPMSEPAPTVQPSAPPQKVLQNETLQKPADTAAMTDNTLAPLAAEEGAQWLRNKMSSVTQLFAPGQVIVDAQLLQRKGALEVAQKAVLITVHAATDSEIETPSSVAQAAARGRSAVAHLVALGISPKRIKLTVSPSGVFSHPNDSEEGRALNRRVDFIFYEKLPADDVRMVKL